ncbi:hypothetical protein AVEN_92593-1 [Araneus ventricosus]|uniref:Uncharacterized protein n=1 Tax=Araneus ventricosus TaxID=182803 RepID=A0A4Y2AHS1_ARAVE|nr:hypothetical protein AVEN_92593-1 [Araneus ventricosus]
MENNVQLIVKLGIDDYIVLLHLYQQLVCITLIHVDRFRRVIHRCSKAHYRRFSTYPPARLTPTHSPHPHTGDFHVLERAPYPPRPDFSCQTTTPTHFPPPQSSTTHR